jgi:hypothetical protein
MDELGGTFRAWAGTRRKGTLGVPLGGERHGPTMLGLFAY